MNYRAIWLTGLIFTLSIVDNTSISCSVGKTHDGLKLVNCSNLNLKTLPKLAYDAQVVDVSKNADLVVQCRFLQKQSSTLVRLILSENYFLARHENNDELFWNMFSHFRNLQEFSFTNSELSNKHQFELSTCLKKFVVDNNNYSCLNLHWSYELVEVSFNYNSLTNLPKFTKPHPPIEIIRARQNPMNQLTAEDVAALCDLSVLELEFPEGSFFRTENGYCRCRKLEQWVKEARIRGTEDFGCFNSNNSCPENSLSRARAIHSKCPVFKSKYIAKILRIGFAIFFFTVLIFCVVFYTVAASREPHKVASGGIFGIKHPQPKREEPIAKELG